MESEKRTWKDRCAEKRKKSEARVESLKAAAGAVAMQSWSPPPVVRITYRRAPAQSGRP